MKYIEKLIKQQGVIKAEQIKNLSLLRVFHDENRIQGSEEKIEGITEELLMLNEQLEQLNFIETLLNEGELKRIYSINQQTKRGEKIS